MARQRGVPDAWRRAQAIEDPRIQVDRARALIAVEGRVDSEQQQVVGIEAEIHALEIDERPHEQPRAGHEHERQRDLGHDEGARQPAAARAGHRGAPGFLQCRAHAQVRRAEGRDDAKQQRRGTGHEHREPEHAHIDVRQPLGGLGRAAERRRQRAAQPGRNRDAERAAGQREQQRFDEQLADDAGARRPDRDANRQFANARPAAREEQARDVRARHDQHDERHQGHRLQGVAHVRAVFRLAAAARQDLDPRQVLRRQVRLRRRDRALEQHVERVLCLGRLYARPEPAEHQHPPEIRVAGRIVVGHDPGLEGQGHVNVRVGPHLAGPVEGGRQETDDRERHPVDGDGPADRRGVTPETRAPELIADHSRRFGVDGVVDRAQWPARRRGDAEHLEVVPRHGVRRAELRAAVDGDVDLVEVGKAEHVQISRGLGLKRSKGGLRKRRAGESRRGLVTVAVERRERRHGPGRPPDDDEAPGVAHRERSKERGVGEAEDGGARADADCQRQHRDQGEDGCAAHLAQAVPDVLHQAVDRRESPHGACLLAQPRHVADRHGGAAARLVWLESFVEESLGLPADVLRQLVAQVVVEPAPAEPGGRGAGTTWRGACSVDVLWRQSVGHAGFITRRIAAISRSKPDSASPRARRPARVSR